MAMIVESTSCHSLQMQVCSRLFKSTTEQCPFKILALADAADLERTG